MTMVMMGDNVLIKEIRMIMLVIIMMVIYLITMTKGVMMHMPFLQNNDNDRMYNETDKCS